MCLVITATPATFDRPGPLAVMTMLLLDPNRITVQHQTVPTVQGAHDLFQRACDALDPHESYCISASWAGRSKPPRGFLAAWRRNEFSRKLNRNQAIAA